MPQPSGSPPDRDHWSRLRPQLEALLELEGDAREAALCDRFPVSDDRVLVRELLAEADSDVADGLSVPPVAIDPTDLAPGIDTVDGPAERVGAWELRRCIGAGGMGEVWLAVRADGHFTQRAALKRIHAEMDGAEIVARFERERQVLASLDHPGIARLLDGGVDREGRPYLVMEFIDGVPIDRWCDERDLDARARVRLLVDVARAVDAAHALQVVHRDLKPSNVLVDQADRPRLIDFGVAKVLDPEKDAASHVTRDITRYVTPAFTSPEQLTGERVSPASDVYSLGALAHVLLTGKAPLDVTGRPPAEMLRMLIEDEPPLMSAVARRSSAPGRADDLRGDLDTVIGACLCKEPARRYARAGDLADDLQRWLDGEVVKAHADGVLYRARRFVLRNRAVVAATALAFAILVIGLVVVVAQQKQLRDSHDALATRRAEAEGLLDDLRTSVRVMMAKYYPELAAIPGTERVLGRMVRATSAVALRQGDPVLLVQAMRAQSLHARSLWTPFRDSSGDPVGALAAHERARELALEVIASNTTVPFDIGTVAESRGAVLNAIFQSGRLDDVLEEAAEMESWLRANMIYVPQSPDEQVAEGKPTFLSSALIEITALQSTRASTFEALGRAEEAEEVVAKAIELAESFDFSGTIGDLEMADTLTFIYRKQATLLSARGEDELARESLEKAHRSTERAWSGHVAVQGMNDGLAFNILAGTSLAQPEGEVDSSWIALLDATEDPDGSSPEVDTEVDPAVGADEWKAWTQLNPVNRARFHGAAALAEMDAKHPAEAARHGRRAVEILEGLLAGRKLAWVESKQLRALWLVRGQAHAQNGELLEASRFLGLALADAEEALAAEPRDFEARTVAVDAALAFAELATDESSKRDWARRAKELIAAADCDEVGRRSLAARR